MKRKHSKSFDWYGISQRFSIRKYHFGAASVLLGVALAMGTPVLAHADDQMSAEPAVEVSSSVPVTPVSETLQTTDSTAVSGSDTQSNTAQQEKVPTPAKEEVTPAPAKVETPANVEEAAPAKTEEAAPAEKAEQATPKYPVVRFPATNTVPKDAANNAQSRPENEGQTIAADKAFRNAENVTSTKVQVGKAVTATATISVPDQDKYGNVKNGSVATMSFRVDIPKNAYRENDTITIRFDELGAGGPRHTAMKHELVSDKGIVYATLTSNRQESTSYTEYGSGSSAYWAQRNDKFSATEKKDHHIKAEGYSWSYTYTFNKNIEGMDRVFFGQELINTLYVPRVNEKVPIVAKISVNNVPVVTKNLIIGAEPIQTTSEQKDNFGFSTTGEIELNKDGEVVKVTPTLLLRSSKTIEQDSLFTLHLKENKLSKFVQTGNFGIFTAKVEGGFNAPAALVNENKVILFAKRTSPKFQVVKLAENELTLRVVEGTLEPGLNYRIYPEQKLSGFDRVFTDETPALLQEAVKKGDKLLSLEGGVVTLTKPLGDKETRTEKQEVTWGIRYPNNIHAFSGGILQLLDGNVIMRYVDEQSKSVIQKAKSVVDTEEGLLVNTFTTATPAEDFGTISTSVDNRTKVEEKPANGVKNYAVTAPYLIKDDAGNYYAFTRYSTPNDKNLAYGNVQTAGTISPSQTNVIANYRKLAFGSVKVHYVLEDNQTTALQNPTDTVYNGQANNQLTSLEGKNYDVSSVTAPASIEKDGLMYVRTATTPANLTGKLTNGVTDVYYTYAPKAGKPVKVKYETTDGVSIGTEKIVKSDGTQVGTSYDASTADYKLPEITEGNVTYILDAVTPVKQGSAPENGTVSDAEQVVTYRYQKDTQRLIVKFVVESTDEQGKITETPIPNAEVTATGRSNTVVPTEVYTSVDEKIRELERQGYALKPNGNTLPVSHNFDNDPTVDEEFKVIVVKPTVWIPVGPQNPDEKPGTDNPMVPLKPETPIPLQPNDPIDPTKPEGPKWTEEKIREVTENISKTFKRTVRYVADEDNTQEVAPSRPDSVVFARSFLINVVDQTVKYTDWEAVDDKDSLKTEDSPLVKGRILKNAGDKVVPEKVLMPTTPESEVVDVIVPYVKVAQFVPNYPGGETPVDPKNPANPLDPTQPIPYPNDPKDPGKILEPKDPDGTPTPNYPVIPSVPGFVPVGPDNQPLQPVDPTDPTKGYVPPVPTTPDVDTPINYVKVEQTAIITIKDEATNQAVDGGVERVAGKAGDSIMTPQTTAKLAELKKKGYVVVSTDLPENPVFDKESDGENGQSPSQSYTVVVKEPVLDIPVRPTDPKQPVGPNNPLVPLNPNTMVPVEPGQPINPDNPEGPKWTPELIDQVVKQSSRTVTRKISYVNEVGTEVDAVNHPAKTDTVTFTRDVRISGILGEDGTLKVDKAALEQAAWAPVNNDTTFDAVASPVITGYVLQNPADKEKPEIANLSADSYKDEPTPYTLDEKVVYVPTAQFVPNYPGGETPVDPKNPANPLDPTQPIPYPNDPKDPGKILEPKDISKEYYLPVETSNKDQQNLPHTGQADESAVTILGVATLLGSLGIATKKRRRREK